jgi:hypothetical protein
MEHLQDYTLNDLNMQSIIKQQLTRTNALTNSKEQKKRAYSSQASTESSLSADTSFFEPREADSLFWILFVMQYGVHEYNSTIHRNVILEKKCKFEFIEKIRQNKSIVKTNGYSTLTHLENVLAYEPKIDIPTFFTMCAIENKNAVYIKNRTFFELKSNNTSEVHLIHMLENKKFAYELTNYSNVDIKKATLYQLEAIDKPIRNIAYYKLQDLVDICIKLEINTNKENNKTKTKNELYESIIQKIEL